MKVKVEKRKKEEEEKERKLEEQRVDCSLRCLRNPPVLLLLPPFRLDTS